MIVILYSGCRETGKGLKADQRYIEAALIRRSIPYVTFCVDRSIGDPNERRELFAQLREAGGRFYDFRFCRGVPRRWMNGYREFFEPWWSEIICPTEEGPKIATAMDWEALNWVLRKTNQMEAAKRAGVRTINTTVCGNVAELCEAMVNRREDARGMVIKPSISSGGDRIFVVDRDSSGQRLTGSFFKVDPSGVGSKQSVECEGELSMAEFITSTSGEADFPFLVQDFVEFRRELSAIYIEGIPHHVERWRAEGEFIAHERFGGENLLVDNPSQDWCRAADAVYAELPPAMKHSLSLRIDFFETLDGQLLFSEVEAASNRIMIPESLKRGRSHEGADAVSLQHEEGQESAPLKRYVEGMLRRSSLGEQSLTSREG